MVIGVDCMYCMTDLLYHASKLMSLVMSQALGSHLDDFFAKYCFAYLWLCVVLPGATFPRFMPRIEYICTQGTNISEQGTNIQEPDHKVGEIGH
jgi:hypothetical protein